MEKFNGFEQWFIETAINAAVQKAEQDVIEAEKSGKNLIYAQGYFTMVGDEINAKVKRNTKKDKR